MGRDLEGGCELFDILQRPAESRFMADPGALY